MKLNIEKNIVINNPETQSFLADAFVPDSKEQLPLIIFVHGFKGYKDWGAWNLFCEELALAGNYVVKFNFSFNGTTLQEPDSFADLEAFGMNNYTKELSDLKCVLDYFTPKPEINSEKVILVGHSRGGGISVLTAFKDDRVTHLVTMGGVCDFKSRFARNERLKAWKKEGVMYSENKRTSQNMPLYYQFYEDFIVNEVKYNIQKAAQHLKKPYLIIHGSDDEAVSLKEANNLNKWCKTSKLLILEKANHTFGTKEPWNEIGLPSDLQLVVSKIVGFVEG